MEVTVLGSTFTVAVGTLPTEIGGLFIPFTDGIEVGAGPVTDVTGAISIFTGFWFSAKLATPGRLRAARASIKFSEIRTRK